MTQCALIYHTTDDYACGAEILSLPAGAYPAALAKACGCQTLYWVGVPCSYGECAGVLESPAAGSPSLFSAVEPVDQVLVFFEILPALTRETLEQLLSKEAGLLADASHKPLALWAPYEVARRLSGRRDTLVEELQDLGPVLTEVSLAQEDGCALHSPLELYRCQELLRQRINRAHMAAGVVLVDPTTTHICPDARIEAGALIMPGCYIYGRSHIEAMAKVGPNAMIVDSVIGCGASVNSSQVIESVVGSQTTVGPYAYIRPGCDVGEKVRIGDFVELKKAKIGNGTKIAHLSYLGRHRTGRALQHWGRRHRRQLRRQEKIQNGGGQRLLHRLQRQPGLPGTPGGRQLRFRRFHHHRRRAQPGSGHCPGPASQQRRLGEQAPGKGPAVTTRWIKFEIKGI